MTDSSARSSPFVGLSVTTRGAFMDGLQTTRGAFMDGLQGRTSQILEGLVSFCQDLLYLASRQNTGQI